MLFINNKYHKWYISIVANAQTRTLPKTVYTERHHIVPRTYGGDNTAANLVHLTAREHLICHLLLTKCVSHPEPMIRAVALMSGKHTIKSRIYATLREQYAVMKRSEMVGENNHYFGKTHSTEIIHKLKSSLKQHYSNPETKARIKKARTMWRHNQANKTLWAMADVFYIEWVSRGQIGCWIAIEKAYNLKKCSIQGIIEHFMGGWNPSHDLEWLEWKSQIT